LADGTHYQTWRKLDSALFVVDYAATLLVDLAGSFTVDSDAGYLKDVQGTLVNPFDLPFSQYPQRLIITNEPSCCHR
jgi:hypothetical protein